jgi:thermitase
MRLRSLPPRRWFLLFRVILCSILVAAFLLPAHPGHAQAPTTDPTPEISVEEAALLLQNADTVDAASSPIIALRGLLNTVPLLGIGYWGIQTNLQETRLVLVLDLNILNDGPLPIGSWVRAKARLNLLGIVLATQIELDDYEPGQVVVRLANGVSPATIASRYNLTLRETLLTSGNIHLFTTPSPNDDVQWLISRMAVDGDITWAELNYIGGPPEGDPYRTWGWGGKDPSGYSNQLAFQQVNLAPAHAHYRGAGVTVAVLDSGVDLQHPALLGHLDPGYDMVADDDLAHDEGAGLGWGHGTHIAGIIRQVAPESRVLPVRVLDANGRGNTFTLAYAIEWAVRNGADVINLSLGTPYDSKVLRETVAWAQAQGAILVAAAGNSNTSSLQYPVGYPGVIGVTALAPDDRKADFANYGSWVELAAPGVAITSTIIGPEGSGYAAWSGTSMATPFVSGAAALARQQSPTASPAEIATLLMQHGRNLSAQNPQFSGQLGTGLDIGQALTGVSTAATFVVPEQHSTFVYLPLTMR